MGRGFYSQGPLERNESIGRWEEWSGPASDGGGRRTFPFPPHWPTDHIQGPLPLLPHQKIDFLQTGAVLGLDLPL